MKRVLLVSGLATVVIAAVALGVAFLGSSSDSAPTTGAAPSTDPKVPVEDELNFATDGWSTDFARHRVPLGEFSSGGPGKDGIPAIDTPRFVAASEADFLERREPVVQLELNGEARAYPLQILIWHEIVNDTIGETPVAVTESLPRR